MVMLESLMMHTIVLGFSGYLDAVTELCVASDVIQLKIEVLAVWVLKWQYCHQSIASHTPFPFG